MNNFTANVLTTFLSNEFKKAYFKLLPHLSVANEFTYLPWTKWPQFRRQDFEMQFHEWKKLYFDSNVARVSRNFWRKNYTSDTYLATYYSNVTMSILSSKVTGNPTVSLTVCLD